MHFSIHAFLEERSQLGSDNMGVVEHSAFNPHISGRAIATLAGSQTVKYHLSTHTFLEERSQPLSFKSLAM